VKQFEGVLAGAKTGLDQLVAASLSGGVQALEALRYQLDAVRFGETEAAKMQEARRTEAQVALQQTPEALKARAEATKELAEAQAELARVGETEAAKIARLRAEAVQFDKKAAGAVAGSVEQIKAQTEAVKLRTDAGEALVKLQEEERKAQSEAGKAVQFFSGAALTGRESVDALKAAVARLQYELASLDAGTPEGLEARIKKYDELTKKAEALEKATENAGRLGAELGMTFSSAFEDAVIDGEKLSEVLRGLAQDVLRIFLRETITARMAKGLGTFFGGFFADGGRPPVGVPSVVGEEGPELFVPDSAGTIVPNHRLGAGGGGPSFTFNYSFASGVTRQEVAGLLPQLVESSKRAVAEAMQRGGGYRRAFA